MRCQACDAALNDKEATRRAVSTGEFVDLCDRCFATVASDIPVHEREFEEEPGEDDWIDSLPDDYGDYDE